MKEWKLILEKIPLSGSLNMATDDFLFQSLGENSQTYLRFYQWESPTVSLGYSQSVERVVDVEYCQKHGIDIVRRMTGGKLVLHHKEVTYSLCSLDEEVFTSTLSGSYRLISEALMKGLEKMGLEPFLADAPPDSYLKGNLPCFSYPARNEIGVNGKKIVGSAQKRMGSRFIQHGSIPLEKDENLLRSVSLSEGKDSDVRMTSISRELGKKVSFEWVVNHLIEGISEYFNVEMKSKTFDSTEKVEIFRVQKERYAAKGWTYLRKPQEVRPS
ncbi:MAG: lipoate--protein ligase family protein [Candidatus Aminicenantes bacterium]|nr:MAG: lipoate--protein ligase family protein [Candidatus Aminicenantes bacterium]